MTKLFKIYKVLHRYNTNLKIKDNFIKELKFIEYTTMKKMMQPNYFIGGTIKRTQFYNTKFIEPEWLKYNFIKEKIVYANKRMVITEVLI